MRRFACPVCRDDAERGTVLEVGVEPGSALVQLEGRNVEVATDLVGKVRPGDGVLVHVGFAIAILDDGSEEEVR